MADLPKIQTFAHGTLSMKPTPAVKLYLNGHYDQWLLTLRKRGPKKLR